MCHAISLSAQTAKFYSGVFSWHALLPPFDCGISKTELCFFLPSHTPQDLAVCSVLSPVPPKPHAVQLRPNSLGTLPATIAGK